MSLNKSSLGFKVLVGISSAAVSVIASALTEKAITKAFTDTETPEVKVDTQPDIETEPEIETIQEEEK